MSKRVYWPWGIGLDKRQARRLRRRLGRAHNTNKTHTNKAQGGQA